MEYYNDLRAVLLSVVSPPLSFTLDTSRGDNLVGVSAEDETVEDLL